MRWSQLQKLIYNVWDLGIGLQIHCTAYPLSGTASVGRYWITLRKETIWDVPKDFPEERAKGTYNPVASEISKVLRDYLDTPTEKLIIRDFPIDRWGLVEILLAADRRIGKKNLQKLSKMALSRPAMKVLRARGILTEGT